MQMNANQLTKIPVEKLSDTLQFLIVENEIPLSDALKQVIDDVDAVCKKLLRDEQAPAQPVIPGQLTQRMTEEKALSLGAVLNDEEADVFADGWNACRAEMLKAQPVSEPYKLPELNDELIEILGRPNFTCAKLAECLRNCGQHIKRKSEHEQAAVLHVLLNLYIKHGNDWRKHAEEAFTPAVAQESE